MKQLLRIFFIVLTFAACDSKDIVVEKYINNDSTKNWVIHLDYAQFYAKETNLRNMCKELNRVITSQVNQLASATKDSADHFFTSYVDTLYGRPAFQYELDIQDSVFLVNKHYISVRLSIYQYQGGAHGMTTFSCYNLDLHNGRLLTLDQYLHLSKRDEIDRLLQQYFKNEEGCFSEKPTLSTPGFAGFNIGKEYINFTYEAYALGAYACGPVTIAIPIKELQAIDAIKHP